MAESDCRRRRSLIPFVPRIPGIPNPFKFVPNPLAWLPRPRIFGGGRPRSPTLVISASSLAVSSSAQASSSSYSGGAASAGSKVPLKPASDVLAGALARAASQSTIHPLDTLKVRLQTRLNVSSSRSGTIQPLLGLSKIGQLVPPSAAGASSANTLKMDFRALGANVGSLYRGVFGAASGAGIAIGAYFAFYGIACNTISTRMPDMSPGGVAFAAGGIAALGSSFVKVPLAVCIRSVQAGVYPNFIEAAKSIVKAAGPRGLFTGYLPTVLEDVPDMAIKFAAYESMRGFHSRMCGGRTASVPEDFAMGAVAGAAAAAATTPLDVIKTNMMCAAASRPTMLGAAAAVHAQGGASAFFRGVGTRALSNGINSAVFFCFFEALRSGMAAKRVQQMQREREAASGMLLEDATAPLTLPDTSELSS